MRDLVSEITLELIGTMGSEVKGLQIEDFDALEYENVCHDFEITLDVAREVFPQALAKAKVAVEEIEVEMETRPNCLACGSIYGGREEFGGMCERCISS